MNLVTVDRLVGLLFFLPVPVVLALLTRQPLDVRASLALAVVLLVTHRFYARPWALARATQRCLWCGRAAGGPTLEIDEPGERTVWRACGAAHAQRVASFLGWAGRRAWLLRAGILGALAVVIAGPVLAATGRLGGDPLLFADTFRVVVALVVLPLGWFGPSAAPAREPFPAPFPVHIQALVGSVVVAWLFRLVGIWWLLDGGLALARRLAGA